MALIASMGTMICWGSGWLNIPTQSQSLHGSALDWNSQGDLQVPVMAYVGDKPVFRAQINMYVSQA